MSLCPSLPLVFVDNFSYGGSGSGSGIGTHYEVQAAAGGTNNQDAGARGGESPPQQQRHPHHVFLTHAHCDHFVGLTERWSSHAGASSSTTSSGESASSSSSSSSSSGGILYCSAETLALVLVRFPQLDRRCVRVLPWHRTVAVETLLMVHDDADPADDGGGGGGGGGGSFFEDEDDESPDSADDDDGDDDDALGYTDGRAKRGRRRRKRLSHKGAVVSPPRAQLSLVNVTMLPVDHCCGAAMFVFESEAPGAGKICHTGDFRWTDSMKADLLLHPDSWDMVFPSVPPASAATGTRRSSSSSSSSSVVARYSSRSSVTVAAAAVASSASPSLSSSSLPPPPALSSSSSSRRRPVDVLFVDTTFLDPFWGSFPTQDEAVAAVLDLLDRFNLQRRVPVQWTAPIAAGRARGGGLDRRRTVSDGAAQSVTAPATGDGCRSRRVVLECDMLGVEPVLEAVARHFGCRVRVSRKKWREVCVIYGEEDASRLFVNGKAEEARASASAGKCSAASRLDSGQLEFVSKRPQTVDQKQASRRPESCAFTIKCSTQWTRQRGPHSSASVLQPRHFSRPWYDASTNTYHVIFSVHSSHNELVDFVTRFVKPRRVVPTVSNDNGAANSKLGSDAAVLVEAQCRRFLRAHVASLTPKKAQRTAPPVRRGASAAPAAAQVLPLSAEEIYAGIEAEARDFTPPSPTAPGAANPATVALDESLSVTSSGEIGASLPGGGDIMTPSQSDKSPLSSLSSPVLLADVTPISWKKQSVARRVAADVGNPSPLKRMRSSPAQLGGGSDIPDESLSFNVPVTAGPPHAAVVLRAAPLENVEANTRRQVQSEPVDDRAAQELRAGESSADLARSGSSAAGSNPFTALFQMHAARRKQQVEARVEASFRQRTALTLLDSEDEATD